MGDWNAVIWMYGDYGLGERNARRNRLVEFCMEHKLGATNTLFKDYERRLYG